MSATRAGISQAVCCPRPRPLADRRRSLLPGVLLGSLLLLCALTGSASAWADTVPPPTSAADVTRLTDLAQLPYLDDHTASASFSSHARDGSNLDFLAASDPGDPNRRPYLYRDSQGRYVLLDASGPGAITRLWMTQTTPGVRTNGDVQDTGRIQIFLDGEDTPRVDLPADQFFSGQVAPFLKPLCASSLDSSGGNFCLVPMAFANGAKVVVTGRPNYWNIEHETYPAGTPVRTFDPGDHITRSRAQDAAALWAKAGQDPNILPHGDVQTGETTVAPGAAAPLLDLPGPGTLRAITLSIDPHGDAALRDVWLEITWDGHSQPDVAAPLADLFLTGAGERAPAHGLLAGYDPSLHQGYLYLPMPFATSAHVALVNRGAAAVAATWRIEQSPASYAGVGSHAGELHATFAQDPATKPGNDYVMLDAPGRGRVVGVSLTEAGSQGPTNPLYMEGDERVYLDGSRTPQIYGTGTEDVFSGGFYFNHGPFTLPTHGMTTTEQTATGSAVSQYRLLLGDGWRFHDGAHLGIEHGGGDGVTTATRSVVFWYGAPHPTLIGTDTLDVGDGRSETEHGYTSTSVVPAIGLTAFYEGDHDGNLSSPALDSYAFLPGSQPPPPGTDPMGEAIVDDGRYHSSGSTIRFHMSVEPDNDGIVLRRRLDQAVFSQRALVSVDGAEVGVWSTPWINDSKRWADSDFAIPAPLTNGRRTLEVELRVLDPVVAPGAAGGVPDQPTQVSLPSANVALSGWTDFRYDAYAVQPVETR